MNFRKVFYTLTFALLYGLAFSQEKWNIIIGNWQDLSFEKDKSVGVMLKKSISSQLQKTKGFNVVEIKEGDIFFDSTGKANQYCLSNRGDVIVYGYYYIEGKSLLVITEVWDVLKKQLKMREQSKGVVTVDIFDTIDEIALRTREKIQKALPVITLEEEVEVKKLRETVYEKEKLKIERLFYTRIGFNLEMGNKIINFPVIWNYDVPVEWGKLEGRFPELFTILGFTIRYWDIRFDFFGGSLPGLPVFVLDQGKITDISHYNIINFSLSYYLPFWNKQFAFGIGVFGISTITGAWMENEKTVTNLENNGILNPFVLIFFWNPVKSFEFSISINPFMNQFSIYEVSGGGKEYKQINYTFPFTSLSFIYFVTKDIGIESRFTYANGRYLKGKVLPDNSLDKPIQEADSEFLSLYLGLVYKVDFLEIEKEKEK